MENDDKKSKKIVDGAVQSSSPVLGNRFDFNRTHTGRKLGPISSMNYLGSFFESEEEDLKSLPSNSTNEHQKIIAAMKKQEANSKEKP